jgi:hypothetical protein
MQRKITRFALTGKCVVTPAPLDPVPFEPAPFEPAPFAPASVSPAVTRAAKSHSANHPIPHDVYRNASRRE